MLSLGCPNLNIYNKLLKKGGEQVKEIIIIIIIY